MLLINLFTFFYHDKSDIVCCIFYRQAAGSVFSVGFFSQHYFHSGEWSLLMTKKSCTVTSMAHSVAPTGIKLSYNTTDYSKILCRCFSLSLLVSCQSHTTRRGRASCSLWYARVANVCD